MQNPKWQSPSYMKSPTNRGHHASRTKRTQADWRERLNNKTRSRNRHEAATAELDGTKKIYTNNDESDHQDRDRVRERRMKWLDKRQWTQEPGPKLVGHTKEGERQRKIDKRMLVRWWPEFEDLLYLVENMGIYTIYLVEIKVSLRLSGSF